MKKTEVIVDTCFLQKLSSEGKKTNNIRKVLGQYTLQIFDGVQLITEIAKKNESSMTDKELEDILKSMGEKAQVSEIKRVWRENHVK
jgi:hypothetical protein